MTTRTPVIRTLLASLILLIGSQTVRAIPPNIVMIMADDLSWVGTSVQMDPNNPASKSDYHRTPRLEQMAAEGMVFTRNYSAGPNCSSTRAALQTGKSPAQMRVTDIRNGAKYEDIYFKSTYNGFPLTPPQPRNTMILPGETTLPEMLKGLDPNYRTAVYGKEDWWPAPTADGYDAWNSFIFGADDPINDPHDQYDITNAGLTFMQTQVQAGKPFFIDFAQYTPKSNTQATPAATQSLAGVPLGTKHYLPGYAAAHKDLDTNVGIVLDRIRDLGIENNTYVIFVSDHGAPTDASLMPMSNAPLTGGKGMLFEGGVRVPMIVKGPGIAPGTYSSVPVNTQDIFPTMYDIAGGTAPLPDNIEGTSFLSVLHNGGNTTTGENYLSRREGPNGEMFWHFPHNSAITFPTGRVRPMSSILDGDYKLIRMYGENGEPDTKLLFNITQNLNETNDPASPLNLASQFPGKVTQLEAKLDNWLDSVDASQAFDVRNPLHLTWKADQRGNFPNGWRSQEDVDYFDREVWLPGGPGANPTGPAQVATTRFQPGLPTQAFQFDGTNGFFTRYFQVSDANKPDLIDADHSATFETWVKLDSLTSQQLLFESGVTTQGISLTLGDSDNIGGANDLRFRILGKTGNNLTITGKINSFADPTKDFVHIAAVIHDQNNLRNAELYVNGALIGSAAGVLGTDELDWDGFYKASLGAVLTPAIIFGDTFGGASGGGTLPFTGGNLRGQIAEFQMRNYALTPQAIQESYNSKLSSVNHGLSSVSGNAVIPAARPTNVSLGVQESPVLQVMQERNDILRSPLLVNAMITGGTNLSGPAQAVAGLIPAETLFTSYLLQFDPLGQNGSLNALANGSIRFGGDILGIIFNSTTMAATDSLLGSLGNYGFTADRGLTLGSEGSLIISPDRRSLNFNLSVLGSGLLQFRVLTKTPNQAFQVLGDFNADGFVNNSDLNLWKAAFGINSGGDADGDGDTDGRDFLVWQRQFSQLEFVESADFNHDGSVESGDLGVWQQAFGTNDSGDADGDGDTDGRDFLIWQRQYATSFSQESADFNHNGTVGASDMPLWQGAYGVSAGGDADRDGDTDGRDYLIWQRQYQSSSLLATSFAVPEPGTALFLGLAFLAGLCGRNRFAV